MTFGLVGTKPERPDRLSFRPELVGSRGRTPGLDPALLGVGLGSTAAELAELFKETAKALNVTGHRAPV